MPKRTRSYLAA